MAKKNYKKSIFKTKEEWLKAKEQTIGGSEAAMVVNRSKWGNASSLYSKFMLGNKDKPTNERMSQGARAEEHIRALFTLDYENRFIVKAPPKRKYWFFQRLDKPYIACTPDGLVVDKTDKSIWGLEIKDVEIRHAEERELWENNVLIDQYYFQCLQYLLTINDLKGVVLFAHLKYYKYDRKKEQWIFEKAIDKPYWVYRDDLSVQTNLRLLENHETKFYNECILKKERPELVIKFSI